MKYQDKNVYEHKHLMSGYYLHCLDEKYSKKVQLFDKLEDFRDNLIKVRDRYFVKWRNYSNDFNS